MRKRLFTAFLLVASCVCSGFALSLSVQVIQNFNDQKDPSSISYLVEQSLIDYFFESGAIVSSAPVYVLSGTAKDEAALKSMLKETYEGGMDYLVAVKVNYNVDRELKDSAALLLQYIKDVEWTVYVAATGKNLVSGTGKPAAITSANNNEKGIIGFSSQLAAQISAGLQKTR